MVFSDFSPELYQRTPQTVIGFHGCDEEVAMNILNSTSEHLLSSGNDYDWLGDGVYFWLNDPMRALEWAQQTQERKPKKVKTPFVLGAIIDLGVCLNLCERQSVELLKKSYGVLKDVFDVAGYNINEELINSMPDKGGFNLVRPLDCAVIQNLHRMMQEQMGFTFDTVYGYFQEGEEAFPGAGIKEKSHIQVCVRNTACIKGYFLPRKT